VRPGVNAGMIRNTAQAGGGQHGESCLREWQVGGSCSHSCSAWVRMAGAVARTAVSNPEHVLHVGQKGAACWTQLCGPSAQEGRGVGGLAQAPGAPSCARMCTHRCSTVCAAPAVVCRWVPGKVVCTPPCNAADSRRLLAVVVIWGVCSAWGCVYWVA
jgi:hypothetical protein